MDKGHCCLVHVMMVVIVCFSRHSNCNSDHMVSSSEKAKTCNANFVESNTFVAGYLPCDQEYISASYFNNHDKLIDLEFRDFLPRSIESIDLCKENSQVKVLMLKLLGLKRDLIGEGSHRNLVSTIILNMHSDDSVWYHENTCSIILIERLPIGVFADPFELQHLVDREIFSSADVFGDTNLELPSALSNRTVVEIHMNIGCINGMKSTEIVTQLPLHARYPALDSSNNYARVEIGSPDLLVRCRPKYVPDKSCFWAVSNLHPETNSVVWQIPCGNEALSGIVSEKASSCSYQKKLNAHGRDFGSERTYEMGDVYSNNFKYVQSELIDGYACVLARSPDGVTTCMLFPSNMSALQSTLIQQTCPNTFGAQRSSTTEDFHLRFESFQLEEFYNKRSDYY